MKTIFEFWIIFVVQRQSRYTRSHCSVLFAFCICHLHIRHVI